MNDTALEAILRRDRIVVAAALLFVAVLAWTYLAYLGEQMGMEVVPHDAADATMPGMDMPDMDMGAMEPDFRAWGSADFVFVFTMWAVMMVGMMTPSVTPMVLLYAVVGRKARGSGKPFAATGWFFAGYVLVWCLFSAFATICQWLLTSAMLLTPAIATTSSMVGGVILIVAGLYQWTPLKNVCLKQCQAPIAFLTTHGGFRSDTLGALQLGIMHGTYCLGCCWALMALLFVGGVMNTVWIGGIAILILLEKTLPVGQLVSRSSGLLLVAAGIWLSVGAFAS